MNQKSISSTLLKLFITAIVAGVFVMIMAVTAYAAGTITGGTYNAGTGALALTGTFDAVTGDKNDVDPSKLVLYGSGGNYSLTSASAKVDRTSATAVTITVGAKDRTGVARLGDFNIIATAGWNGSSSTTTLSTVAVTVTSGTAPTVASATYDYTAGTLVISGTIAEVSGTKNDIVPKYFAITNGSSKFYALTSSTQKVDRTSASAATITLSTKDKSEVEKLITNTNKTDFILGVFDGWNGDGSLGTSLDTPPSITVTNYTLPVATLSTTTSTQQGSPIKAQLNKKGYLYLFPSELSGSISTVDDLNALVLATATVSTAVKATVSTINSDVSIATGKLSLKYNTEPRSICTYTVAGVDLAGQLAIATSTSVVITSKTNAPVLTTTVAKGTVGGTTKVTATAGSSNTLKYKIASSTIATPKLYDSVSGLTAYTSGDNISGVGASGTSPNKYLGVYEIDGTYGKVVKFKLITLATANVLGPQYSTATGTVATSTTIAIKFDENVSNATASDTTLKAKITYKDGNDTSYKTLGSSDTISITNNVVTITFASGTYTAGTGALKISAGAVKDTYGNLNEAIEKTSVTFASGS